MLSAFSTAYALCRLACARLSDQQGCEEADEQNAPEVPEPIDTVDIFRNSEAVEEALALEPSLSHLDAA